MIREAWPALLFLVAPFLAGSVAALGSGLVRGRLSRGPADPLCAGEWAAREIGARAMSVRVGVTPELVGSTDGFWPERGFVGLSPRTWVDRTLGGRAVAAHELGHALAWRDDGLAARRRGWLRGLQGPALACAGAGVLVGALLDSRVALDVGQVALAVGVLAHVAALLDEGDASWRAASVLGTRGERTWGTDLAMAAAFGAYLAPALVHLVFLAGWRSLRDAALDGGPRLDVTSGPAVWGVLVFAPLLGFRVVQVLADLVGPEPVMSEFRLHWTLFEERARDLRVGLVVLFWLALVWDEPMAVGLGPWFVLGLAPAMGPLAGIGRMLAVIPMHVALALVGRRRDPGARVRAPRPVDPLELIVPESAWNRRLDGLIRLAWVPLLVVLVARALAAA